MRCWRCAICTTTHGHIQEIIIQNFRPKPGTRMADVAAPSLDEHLWTIAMARLMFPPSMNIQAPPNLNPGALNRLVEAGINDWGGVSPVTPDHVNPEAPWPHLRVLERATKAAGKRPGRAPRDLSGLCARKPRLGRSGPADSAAAPYRCRRLAAHRRLVSRHRGAASARRAAHPERPTLQAPASSPDPRSRGCRPGACGERYRPAVSGAR